MKVMSLLFKVLLAPIAIPLASIGKVKNTFSTIKSEIQHRHTENLEPEEDKPEHFQQRPVDWEILSHKAAKRARMFWVFAVMIWLFMGYKIYAGANFLLIYNLLFFAMVLAVFALQSALTCAQWRQAKKIRVISLFRDGGWFPAP